MKEITHCPQCGHHLNPNVDSETMYCPLCDKEIPRYRKKSNKIGLKRSKHKHQYADCLLETNNYPDFRTGRIEGTRMWFGSYCTICGKIGEVLDWERWFTKQQLPFPFQAIWEEHTEEAERELDPETRTIPVFWVEDSIKTKFVELK